MATVKSFKAALLLLLAMLIGLSAQAQTASAQGCSSELSSLNVCAPYVVPGGASTNPGSDCCNALQNVQHDCLCNTLRIAARLPSQCSLPPISCGN